MTKTASYVRVAIPAPLYCVFDYSIPNELNKESMPPGIRLQVPFGKQWRVGILIEHIDKPNFEINKIKPVKQCLDSKPVFDPQMLKLLRWASQYYHHPLGEVTNAALPSQLRKGDAAQVKMETNWQLSPTGQNLNAKDLSRAPKQLALFLFLKENPEGVVKSQLFAFDEKWAASMRVLLKKSIVKETQILPAKKILTVDALSPALKLNKEQSDALKIILNHITSFKTFLLFGETGSGKTEVYMQTIDVLLKNMKQVLILVPEIGLTPQLISRFQKRFGDTLAVSHSGLNDSERLQAWLAAKENTAQVILGTRSAVFLPCPNLGAIIVDEEHDLSFKQQDSFRYSARDVAIRRAHFLNIPIILGSATPSLESMFNARNNKYQMLRLSQRAGGAEKPLIQLIDIRAQKLNEGLSDALVKNIELEVQNNKQVLLFLNRRGFTPTILCHDCGWTAQCTRCDARLTYHSRHNILRCHHCGSEQAMIHNCFECNSKELHHYGQGTEKLESVLKELFPNYNIARIDRDTTRRKGSLEKTLIEINSGKVQIMIGTQMLAKGHHFPNVTLVGIIESDQGLFGADFRTAERLSQLILQVSGRAGRAESRGKVLIQTHHPDNPIMQLIVKQDYQLISENLLSERQVTQFPPYSYLAILRAEATETNAAMDYLLDVAGKTTKTEGCSLLGPMPAPMEKRAGRYRAQLIINAMQREHLHFWITQNFSQITHSKLVRKVRWSIDIDPQEVL